MRDILPREWKAHLITLIYKCGDKAKIRNYWPISLLCILSKVVKKLIYNFHIRFCQQIHTSLPISLALSKAGPAFGLFNNIMNATDGSTSVDVMHLDFCKAYDSVSHTKLLHKLHTYGVSGKLWNWFKSYLHDRQQCVRVGNTISRCLPVLSGIPQAVFWGPCYCYSILMI